LPPVAGAGSIVYPAAEIVEPASSEHTLWRRSPWANPDGSKSERAAKLFRNF